MSVSNIYIGHLGSENSALSREETLLEKFRESNQGPYFELYFHFIYTGRAGKQANSA